MQGTKALQTKNITAPTQYNVGQVATQGGKTYQYDGTNWNEI